MASTRFVIALVVTGSAAVAALVACSGSSTSSTGDGGASSGTSGSNTSGGTSGGTSGSSGSGFKTCPAASSSGTSPCTDAQYKPYIDCIQTACASNYEKCYGAGYKSGQFSGACGTYITCTQACACGDTACQQACKIDDACATCTKDFGSCATGCSLPACATGGSSGTSGASGGKTCADLAACCAAISDPNTKSACNQTYNGVKASGDTYCNAAYSSYKQYCP